MGMGWKKQQAGFSISRGGRGVPEVSLLLSTGWAGAAPQGLQGVLAPFPNSPPA